MGKSKKNVGKSKVPIPPPLPPPPLRQTKSSPPPPPPPLKSTKTAIVKEYSSETKSMHGPPEKSLAATRSNSKSLAVEKGKERISISQREFDDLGHTKSEHQPEKSEVYVSKASWIPQSKPQADFDDDSSPNDESLNQIFFFDEEECSDPNDEFLFTCCVPPYSPRYPNLTLVQDVGGILQFCRLVQTGQEVYLAELHLSSRGVYHTECYKCCLCGKSLDSWSVAEHKSELFCKGCYRRNFALHGCGFRVGAGVLQTP